MQAQHVFDVALAAGASEGDIALIVDRQGGIRVTQPVGMVVARAWRPSSVLMQSSVSKGVRVRLS